MANESAKIDVNQQKTLIGVTNAATPEIRNIKVDATTGRLLCSATVTGAGGDVSGPATNTDGYIPLWDGADSKTLKNGIATTTFALTAQTMYIGTTQVAINRASAALTLAGITLTTPNIGTPSGGTLTSCTGLPVTGIVDSTSAVLGVGSLELGHASDTTLERSAAGVLKVEGVVIPSISSTNTLTNKRVTKRVVTTTDDATAAINTDTTDVYELSAIANATVFTLTGTPTDKQTLLISFKDAGTTKGLTWTGFTAIGVTLPTDTTAGKWHYVGCVYNLAATAWHAIAVSEES